MQHPVLIYVINNNYLLINLVQRTVVVFKYKIDKRTFFCIENRVTHKIYFSYEMIIDKKIIIIKYKKTYNMVSNELYYLRSNNIENIDKNY